MGNGALYMKDREDLDRLRRILNGQLYLIKIFPGTVNGMTWPEFKPITPGEGNYSIIGKTKNNVHLVPEGGTMKDKISIPKNKMKVIRKVSLS